MSKKVYPIAVTLFVEATDPFKGDGCRCSAMDHLELDLNALLDDDSWVVGWTDDVIHACKCGTECGCLYMPREYDDVRGRSS